MKTRFNESGQRMCPVQQFKANFDQPAQDGLPTTPQDIASLVGVQLHDADSIVRNICFAWEDGRKAFFNYAYLIAAEFESDTNQNTIKLSFSSHTISMSGYCLEILFFSLLNNMPKLITVISKRYTYTEDLIYPVVVEIAISKENL
ncbi:hypothetical protein [Fibrella forsythiae]|uniref:Uncharacterized protein n=1 Tax=Fibrella forsythiae TaxID=2817061 RepID=A0ABS3JKR6_9BACT|nr:hypothetical protein [Fibrella forsythiae]MBO0950599.1 hypothetical protein [Fibrella forsythiae]